MLPELGGVTLLAMILCRSKLRLSVLILWVLFAAVAAVHTHGIPI